MIDYAFETRNEEVIKLVDKIIGNDFTSVFPQIMQNQENQIKSNQDTLLENLNKLKELDHAHRISNLPERGETGSILATTLMMMSDQPSAMDINQIKAKEIAQYSANGMKQDTSKFGIFLFLLSIIF